MILQELYQRQCSSPLAPAAQRDTEGVTEEPCPRNESEKICQNYAVNRIVENDLALFSIVSYV